MTTTLSLGRPFQTILDCLSRPVLDAFSDIVGSYERFIRFEVNSVVQHIISGDVDLRSFRHGDLSIPEFLAPMDAVCSGFAHRPRIVHSVLPPRQRWATA